MSAERWLAVQKTAHQVGLKTNATMMFGHVDTVENRLDHLCRLRALQDETNGINCFIPLKYLPDNTILQKEGLATEAPSEQTVLRTIAVARLVLDNIPNIKAYWVILGESLTKNGSCILGPMILMVLWLKKRFMLLTIETPKM